MEHQIELTAEGLWEDVSARLRGALNEKTYRNWFSDVSPAEVSEDTFVLSVPNDFTREWIEGHFVELIRAAIKDATGGEHRLLLTVRQPAPARQASPRPAARPAPKPAAREPARRASPDVRRHAAGQPGQASPAKSPGRWRVIDLTPSEPRQRSIPAPAPARIPGGHREADVQRWGLAAGAEAQGAPGPLPAVFRLDPVHGRNEAGSRAR